MENDGSKLANTLTVASPSLWTTHHHLKECGPVTCTNHLKFLDPNHISKTTETRVVKFLSRDAMLAR